MGFIQNTKRPPEILGTTRTLTVRAFFHTGRYYFRTREITEILGIKQPFSMVERCRKRYGAQSILTGTDTQPFREESDTAETTFISDEYVLLYLKRLANIKQPPALLNDLIREITYYKEYADRNS